QVPLVSGDEFGAAAAHIEAQDRGAARAGCSVVALGGDVDAVERTAVGDRDAFGIRSSAAVGVTQLLALAPAGGAVPRTARAGDELRQHSGAVVDGPEGVAEQTLLVVESREVAAEDDVGGNGCHGAAAGPGRDIRVGARVGRVGAVIRGALRGTT